MRQRLAALPAALLALALGAAPAAADHTTRDGVINEHGVDYVLVALVFGAALVALVVFAAAVLWWERRDAASEAEQAADSEPR
jgi:hypothetical protein